MWIWTKTWNVTVSDTSSNKSVHVNVIFTRTDSNPTLTTEHIITFPQLHQLIV